MMKKGFALICAVALSGFLMAQLRPDSLLREGRKAYLEGNYGAAIIIYKEYYRQAINLGDNRAAGDALRLIGDTFRASNEMQEAVKQLELGLEKAKLANDSALIGKIYNRLSAAYFELPDLKASEENAQKAIQISKRAGDQANVSNSLNILGAIYRSNGQFPKALEVLRQSVNIQRAIGDTLDIPNALNNIAFTHFKMAEFDDAIAVAKESYGIAKRSDIPVYTHYAAFVLTECYRAKMDWENALHWQDSTNDINVRLVSEAKAKEISKLKEEMEISRKEMEIAQREKDYELMKNENALKDQTIARQNAQSIAIGSIAVLVLALTVIFYMTTRRQRRANAALQEKNNQIEQQSREIKAINESLEQAGKEQALQRTRLEEINKVKDKLFSIISHDLRSPLNSIQGLLSLLRQGQLSTDEFKFMTDTLMSRVENTTMLLDNLLNWSRTQMEGFATEPTRLDLHDIALSVCQLLEINARTKGIQIHNHIGPGIEAIGDKNMVELVIRNLVSNAIKFTPQGGSVEIHAAKSNGKMQVSIKDSGPGISEADFEKIMGGTYYFTLGTANEKGSGLGLKLTREFLQKNNGEFWLERTQEKGSTFWFSLPAA